MPYPDRLLDDDEEVAAHLRPHGVVVFWPVVLGLVVVGVASFVTAAVPAGPRQGVIRLAVVCMALVLEALVVGGPLLRWRTTHYVVTTHRLMWRQGVLARRGRNIGLSRIADVSFSQSLSERLIRSGTLTVESAGESGATSFRQIPDCEGVQQLLNHMIEEDTERRGWCGAGSATGDPDHGQVSERWD